MANYVAPIVCDALGNFTSNTTSGTGSNGIDTDDEQEGTGCYWTHVGFGAGTAYSTKTLTSNIGNGAYWHLGFYHYFDKSAFGGGQQLNNNNYVRCIGLYDTANNKRLGMRVDATPGAVAGRVWRIASTAGTTVSVAFDPAWTHDSWRWIDMYGYIDDSAGWMQLWEGGTLWAEFTGADTRSVADFNAINVGINYRQDTDDEVFFAFDYIVCDDDRSPLPPGSGEGAPLRRRIISPWHNDQSTCRGDT